MIKEKFRISPSFTGKMIIKALLWIMWVFILTTLRFKCKQIEM